MQGNALFKSSLIRNRPEGAAYIWKPKNFLSWFHWVHFLSFTGSECFLSDGVSSFVAGF